MRILVTGAAGHLGEGLVRVLRRQGRDVVGLDILSSPFVDVVASVTDADAMRAAAEGCGAIIHTATLHKPHVATHSQRQFVDTNVTGTLTVLETALAAGVPRVVFTSTTSAFGAALTPAPGAPAVWITEDVASIPKNIYGSTKTAAEDLCHLHHRRDGLSCVILRTSRFFPEPDDDPAKRSAFALQNAQTTEFTHRRVDVEDVVSAHLLAAERAEELAFARFIISAPTPFLREDAAGLSADPTAVMDKRTPEWREIYRARGWRAPDSIGRVYDAGLAVDRLGWRPAHDMKAVLARVAAGGDALSELAAQIGLKGYHGGDYRDGIYPV